MTVQQIHNQVEQEANAQLDKVIARLLPLYKNQHAHLAHTGECYCSYCCFIRGDYTKFKLALHRLKCRIRYLDWVYNDVDVKRRWKLEEELLLQFPKHSELKQKKIQLKAG
jgi:hypothetical protein